MKYSHVSRLAVVFVFSLIAFALPGAAAQTCRADNTVFAHVVAIDQPIEINRLGASQPGGMIFALARDVCALDSSTTTCGTGPVTAGQVMLKPYKRPRPMVLRVNERHCLMIGFTNLLSPAANATYQPATRAASVHVQGMEWVSTTQGVASTCTGATCNDGSWVGKNPNGLVSPSTQPLNLQAPQTTYTLYAPKEGTYLLYSTADVYSKVPSVGGSNGDGGQLAMGLFGAVHVEPYTSEWYRSQVTATDLVAAGNGNSTFKQPLISYQATYPKPKDNCYEAGTCRVGPVLRMACTAEMAKDPDNRCKANEIVHSDLTAVITGPHAGRFPPVSQIGELRSSYALPDRQQPFREFTIIYHEMFNSVQAFASYTNIQDSGGNQLTTTQNGEGLDQFGINYGMAGIASEVLANRIGVGPMANCPSCKFEEFFLTSWAVGDPAMVVDNPPGANCAAAGLCSDGTTACTPDNPTQCSSGQSCNLTKLTCTGGPATKALYPDDPSNVYHSYISDHTTFRILHGGSDLHHVHHQHAHQWLHSPDSSDSDYLDSQAIGPGSAFNLEMVFNGSGNVNQTVGDSIFHCHFYPHFAGGMWSMWRVHDVYETGTLLGASGQPLTGPNRALPDGEIAAGTPIPALVPLPTIPMPLMPALVQLATTAGSAVVEVCDNTSTGKQCNNPVSVLSSTGDPKAYKNPGFPFFIPGVGGQRSPHPPLDFAYACSDDPGRICTPKIVTVTGTTTPADVSNCKNPATARCEETAALDGGLPRHLILGCQQGINNCSEIAPLGDYTDFSKTLTKVSGLKLPEDGTFIEQVAMGFHSHRLVDSRTPENNAWTVNSYSPSMKRHANFILNGLKPVAGAPFADPCIRYGLHGGKPYWDFTRHYEAADIQLDATFNREGWHYPQQRMLSLWGDVQDYLTGARPPEPFFFRANSGNCIQYVLANLVPNVYELDDFQVRTPTDILGQHIHLVKFDVTSSDGATNGFNYEDGTFAPNEVTERIVAINAGGGLAEDVGSPKTLTAKTIPFFGPGPGGRWVGAQATIQRWYTDRLFNGQYKDFNGIYVGRGEDRTLRTVFTHDHFGPSTHQQAGLYAGLVIEPEQSAWYPNDAAPSDKPFGGCTKAGLLCNPVPPRVAAGYDGHQTQDGGPTTWQAVIVPQSEPGASFREFMLEFQDSTLTYAPFTGITIPPSLSQGFCEDSPAQGCTPSTAQNFDQPNTGCKSGRCIGYGFCSTTSTGTFGTAVQCTPATSTATENTKSCPPVAGVVPTCNFIPGIPSAVVADANNPPVVPVATWSTTPFDNPKSIELITLGNATNSFSVNYRSEPLFLRTDNAQGQPNPGNAGDLAYAYASIDRGFTTGVCSDNHAFCTATGKPGKSGCADPTSATCDLIDPVTPLLRAYAGDDVQIRTLVGAHINPHNFTVHDVKWLEEPSFVDSGWRNSEVMGISEHFEEIFRLPSVTGAGNSDYLYMIGAANIEQSGGNWGLMRAYPKPETGLKLKPLPQNEKPAAAAACPAGKPKPYTVVALTANQALADHGLVYNQRSQSSTNQAVMADPNAILYFQLADLDCAQPSANCKAKPDKAAEPLVLRANAGDCMAVTLYNGLPPSICSTTGAPCSYGQSCDNGNGTCQMYGYCSNDFTKTCTPQNATAQCGSGNTCTALFPGSNAPNLTPNNVTTYSQCGQAGSNVACASNTSVSLGLHPQLVTVDVTDSSGFNAGTNPDQLAQPGQSKTYTWYAGNIDPKARDPFIPIEFGAANLLPSDTLNHYQYALFGALVIEPQGASCMVNGRLQPVETCRGTMAQIVDPRDASKSFREFVLITQDGLKGPKGPSNGTTANATPFTFQSAALGTDKVNAVNYRFEPLNTNNLTRTCSTGDLSCVLSNSALCCNGTTTSGNQVCTTTTCGEPQTPIFTACAGEQVRFRILHPGGANTNQVFELHGHVWQEQPYMSSGKGCPVGLESPTTQTNLYSSSQIGNKNLCGEREQDTFSEYLGSRMGHGPANHFDALVQAGGTDKVPGDYLYRTYPADHFKLGLWGLFRVSTDPSVCGGGQTARGAAGAGGGGGR